MTKKEIKSKVNIRKSSKGYLIEITDTLTNPVYAITEDELRQIVLYGEIILKRITKNNPSLAADRLKPE